MWQHALVEKDFDRHERRNYGEKSTRETGSTLARWSLPVKNGLVDHAAVPEMLHDNTLQQRRRDAGIPDRIRVDDDDWAFRANAEAWRLAPLDACRPEEQALALE